MPVFAPRRQTLSGFTHHPNIMRRSASSQHDLTATAVLTMQRRRPNADAAALLCPRQSQLNTLLNETQTILTASLSNESLPWLQL